MSASEEGQRQDKGAEYSSHVEAVIEEVRDLPEECCQSTGPFGNVWDEFVEQVSGERSLFFEGCEETIRRICKRRVARMEETEKRRLCPGIEDDLDGEIAEELFQRVSILAVLENLAVQVECELEEQDKGEGDGQKGSPGVYLFRRGGGGA